MQGEVYRQILERRKKGQKSLALLIDPDKHNDASLARLLELACQSTISFIFVGGSLLMVDRVSQTVNMVKSYCNIPVLLFPGSTLQFCPTADALLFLSLISGRNPDLLIGRHVEIAPLLRKTSVEVIPTGYMLIDGGRATTASYISNTLPLPADKPEIAACTAMAGEMLGLKLIYLDSGSGAVNAVSMELIGAVRQSVDLPIIVGGGIRTPEALHRSFRAGADLAVVGNALEENPELLLHLDKAIPSPA